jgi:uncharacterized membrane-anchored protein
MADIDVVPKQRSNTTWVWVLLAIALIAVLIWAFMARTPAATQLIPASAPAVTALTDVLSPVPIG